MIGPGIRYVFLGPLLPELQRFLPLSPELCVIRSARRSVFSPSGSRPVWTDRTTTSWVVENSPPAFRAFSILPDQGGRLGFHPMYAATVTTASQQRARSSRKTERFQGISACHHNGFHRTQQVGSFPSLPLGHVLTGPFSWHLLLINTNTHPESTCTGEQRG